MQVALAVGNRLNQDTAQAFSLESLPKLFEVRLPDAGPKAIHKHLFHIVFKQWMRANNISSPFAAQPPFSPLHLKLFNSLTKLNFSDTCKLAQAMMFDLTNLKDYLIEAEKENRKDEFYE